MVYAAIFDNRQDVNGFDIYETTPHFPQEYLSDIIQVCDRMKPDNESKWALRYAPLKGLFLITVCFRRSEGSDSQSRAYCQGINFLLPKGAAMKLFAAPLRVTDVVSVAQECLVNRLSNVTEAWSRYFNAENARDIKADADALKSEEWEPLLYSCVTHGNQSQLFVESDDAEPLLYALHYYLPLHLRIELPFLINAVALQECRDVELIFCPSGHIDKLQSSQDTQGVATDKIFLKWNPLGWWDGGDDRKKSAIAMVKNLRSLMEKYDPDATEILISCIADWNDLKKVCTGSTNENVFDRAVDYLANQYKEHLLSKITQRNEDDPAVSYILKALEKATLPGGKQLNKELRTRQHQLEKEQRKQTKAKARKHKTMRLRRFIAAASSPRLAALLFSLLAFVLLIFNHFRIVESVPHCTIIITTSGFYSLAELFIAFLAGVAMSYAFRGGSRRGSEQKTD